MFRFAPLAAAVAALLIAAPSAHAQQPPALSVTGIGEADVTPADRNDEAAIRTAVEAANAKALPLAIADGRKRATALAAAAGVKLGPLVSISDGGLQGYGYGPFVAQGPFADGQFCGNVRNTKVVVRNGHRR